MSFWSVMTFSQMRTFVPQYARIRTPSQTDSEEEMSEGLLQAPKSRDMILALSTLRAFTEQHTADLVLCTI